MKTCDDQKPLCGYCQINEKHSCKKYQIHNTQSMPIEHYYFIGECFVETLMMGWTAPELERGKRSYLLCIEEAQILIGTNIRSKREEVQAIIVLVCTAFRDE